ncbi:MAG: DsrE family protein [Pacificimonas sp.]|jgi:predicted peroxiredoxin|nr:DsrE family protein [Pacificimonas sp.]
MPRGLNIIILTADAARARGGLALALAEAALGRPVRLFFQGGAVRLLEAGAAHDGDAEAEAAGSGTLAALIAQTAEMEIALTACETGLHGEAMDRAALVGHAQTGGLIGFLAEAHDADLLTI